MKSWMEERDLFVAQTMAFVDGVAASQPTPVQPQIAAPPTVQVGNAEQPIPAAPERVEAQQAVATLKPPPAVDERAEIQKRVASFKAHQMRLMQDRDRFFHSVMTEIGNSLGSDVTGKSL
jgi:hypothetical protein